MSNLISILKNRCLIYFIGFIIISDLLYTIYISHISDLPLPEEQPLEIVSRPKDGFILDTNRVMRSCDMKFYQKNIEFKRWDTEEQLNSDDLYKGWEKIMSNQRSVAFSDLVRFVVLNRYGGMYMDGDVLFLRDMRPLYHSSIDFSYKWSFK